MTVLQTTKGRKDRTREGKKRDRHINLLIIVLSAVFYLGAAGTAGYYVLAYSREAEVRTTPEPLVAEGNMKTRALNDPGKRQQGLNSVMEEGMMIFSINTTSFMTDGRGKASPTVENPPNNEKRFAVTIQRDDAGRVIYKSDYLDPKQYIDKIPLDVEPPKGEYACTTYFDVYRLSDDGYIGRAGAQIILYMLG